MGKVYWSSKSPSQNEVNMREWLNQVESPSGSASPTNCCFPV